MRESCLVSILVDDILCFGVVGVMLHCGYHGGAVSCSWMSLLMLQVLLAVLFGVNNGTLWYQWLCSWVSIVVLFCCQ